ncbi:hypothetical protein A4S05_04135 [Nostoc sp. KVJ20]|uniref:DUF1643 domain-containing protein n=1 Tax=Nostoc sp. KVJ20 TaxID=457944 RepID=UPI0008687657|nr:DUF1643 domain-containing protein [Nostoc sp. KVJ20]ODG99556.1 hypothetical protein A4S05_04135 [Nostoc sp. KVJ20]
MEIKKYLDMERDVKFDDDISRKYRYSLWCRWDATLPQVTFVMLNPSKADEKKGDSTLTRCIDFAKFWKKYGSLEVVNLFAYIATQPPELSQPKVNDPVGEKNNFHIQEATKRAELIILAWGTGKYPRINNRNQEVLNLISGQQPLHCLKLTKDKDPHHPRGLKNNIEPIIFPYKNS